MKTQRVRGTAVDNRRRRVYAATGLCPFQGGSRTFGLCPKISLLIPAVVLKLEVDVNFCPACGKGNPDHAKYCSECRTRLVPTGAMSVQHSGGKGKVGPAPRSGKIGRGFALIGVAAGVLGIAAAVILISSAVSANRAGQTLEQEEISLAEVAVYVDAVNRQLGQLESEVNKLRVSADDYDMARAGPAQALLDGLRTDLEDVQQAEDEEELNEIRARIKDGLVRVRALVAEQ